MRPAALRYGHSPTLAAMPPKGVDQPAREAMTTKIAQRLTTMLAGQNMIEAARQIEAKCYDSAKDATDYKRKVEKRLAKAAKALEAFPSGPRKTMLSQNMIDAARQIWRAKDGGQTTKKRASGPPSAHSDSVAERRDWWRQFYWETVARDYRRLKLEGGRRS